LQAWFHAAGVLQDGLLANQVTGMLRQSYAAKSHAASTLHIALGSLPLSCQVCACRLVKLGLYAILCQRAQTKSQIMHIVLLTRLDPCTRTARL